MTKKDRRLTQGQAGWRAERKRCPFVPVQRTAVSCASLVGQMWPGGAAMTALGGGCVWAGFLRWFSALLGALR